MSPGPSTGSRLALRLVAVLVCLGGAIAPVVAVTAPMTDAGVRDAGSSVPAEELTGADTGAAANAAGAGTGSGSDPVDSEVVSLRHEYRLTPGDPGSVTIQLRFEIPESVVRLEATVPSSAAVTRTGGFDHDGGRVYAWDNETTPATITYRLPVNETKEGVGPEGGEGRYQFVDAGPWALFRRPQVGVRATARNRISIDQEWATAGPGVVGGSIVYLGPSETHRRTAHGQTFRLVVPDRASLSESPEAVLDALASASDRLRVGDRDDVVHVFAAPTTAVEWGVRGLHLGDADMWVRDVERLSKPENVWIHEYVHSRQAFRTTGPTAWTTEGIATYYAALLALEEDRISFETFRTHLRTGTRDPQADSVLAEPSTWRNAAQYLKGMLVAGDVDRRIRLASGGTRSFQWVFSKLNAADGTVDEGTLLGLIEDASNRSVRRTAERFTTTRRAPGTWDGAAHAEAFGTAPALISLGFAEDALTVSGPYRNASIQSPTVVTNETLTVRATLVNSGGKTGTATGTFRVDGREVSTERVTLDPGESRTANLSYTFDAPGEYTLAFGDDTMTVAVERPARAPVTATSVNRTRLPGPGAVEFTATVANNGSVPAERTVTVRRNGDGVARRTVALAPDESRTVRVPVRLPRPGQYTLGAGRDAPITVVVADPTTPTESATTTGSPATGTADTPPTTGTGTPTLSVDSPTAARGSSRTTSGGPADGDTGGSGAAGPAPGVAGALVAVLVALLTLRRRD